MKVGSGNTLTVLTLSERLAAQLREFSERRGFKVALARRLNFQPSAITPYVTGERPMSLEVLEAVSELASVPLAELVAAPGSSVRELNADEAALLRALRRWPLTVTRSLCAFVAFFADEEPVAAQTRNFHELWRRMDQTRRDRIFSLAQLMSEGVLTPDLLSALQERLVADRAADANGGGSGSRRRRERT